MAFATPDDLADFLGRDRYTDPTEYRQASMLLDLATAAIQAWTRQTIELVADNEVTLAGTWQRELLLPERPVVSVAQVAVGGVPLAAADWSLVGGALYSGPAVEPGVVTSSSLPVGATGRGHWHWGGPDQTVTVTYTHGYATPPAEVKAVCLAVAARGVMSPAGAVRQESVGSYSVTYAGQGGPSLTDGEMRQLAHLRRRSL